MKLTNEQKKRLIIGGAIEAYEEEPIIAKEVDGKVVIGVDDLNTYFTWNDSKGTLDKERRNEK